MIVPMKKVHVLTLEDRRESTVAELGQLGIVHVGTKSQHSDSLENLYRKRVELERAQGVLEAFETRDAPTESAPEPQEFAQRVLELADEQRGLRERLTRLADERERLAPWENVSPEVLRKLRDYGIELRLYELDSREAKRFPGGYRAYHVGEESGRIRLLVLLGKGEEAPEGFEPLPEPPRTLDDVDAEQAEVRTELARVENELRACAGHRKVLAKALEPAQARIEFEEVRAGMAAEGRIAYLTGYMPADATEKVQKYAADKGWGIMLTDPDPSDPEVPTLVRRGRFARLISPVFDMIKTVPGYSERDISTPFLLFFAVFFAMILSDGGYGLLVLVGTAVAIAKARSDGKPIRIGHALLVVLGVVTTAWGAMTGVWFGYEPIAELPGFRSLIVPALDQYQPGSDEAVMLVSLTLAVLQLSLARLWNIVRLLRSPYPLRAVEQVGWLVIVLCVYNLVLFLVFGAEQFPILGATPPAIAGGFAAILLFSNQHRTGHFLKDALQGFSPGNLIPTGLNGISAFSDTVSYIRLFAVGLASIRIAEATNDLAMQAAEGAGGFVALLIILLIGHTLNLAMGGLSVLVHGVRLNVLEFSNHLGMEWSGIEYRPFRQDQPDAA